MTTEMLLPTLQLIRSENLGPLTFYKLLNRYKNPQTIIENWADIGRELNRKITLATPHSIHEEIEKTHQFGGQLITVFDAAYPQLLKQLPDAPPVLVVKGNSALLNSHIMGIVGARNASTHGRHMAFKIAESMGKSGWIISSGLARGIDTQAHRGALATGTIAVVAGGINIIYPEENKALYEQIAQTGLILTEVQFNITPQAAHFPRRNRLISGLAQGLLVVEASVQSGSLITANFATDQGREVFAIPGSPMDPRCRGTNFLLKQGAILTESAEDILNVLEKRQIFHPIRQVAQVSSEEPYPVSDDRENLPAVILQHLNASPLPIHHLIQHLNVPLEALWPTLLDLELQGKIERHAGDAFSKLLLT